MGGDETEVGGTMPQRIASCMEALGALMALPHAVGASMVLADKRRAKAAGGQQDLVHQVANILGEGGTFIMTYCVHLHCHFTVTANVRAGIKDPANVSQSASLAELGMDSLMGAEIKQTLERGHDLVLGVQEIRTLTFARLRELAGGVADGAQSAVNGAVADAGDTVQVFATVHTLAYGVRRIR